MSKKIYYSRNNLPTAKAAPAGSKIKKTYGIKIDETGHKIVYVKGEKDVYAEIQSHADSVNIDNIIKKATLGDTSGFKKGGVYGDFTNMPTSLAEAQEMIQDLKEYWKTMSVEERREFNHSPEEFIANVSENIEKGEVTQ